ncbi:cilia- and flagella-associated protein 91 [Mugil cephalus]|uniref:cilia- and flagella-associated protein 91 n=1 Tax=Mugil cephalus TaxID=48193 RepID=UPI001FB6FB10|nr:cilia- and flagella-associated protein 91 [Mugil cephalus]
MNTSVTRTVTRPNDARTVFRRERVYDHLYDPEYKVSSEADHARANLKAYASKNRVRRVPEFSSMFSDYPCYTLKLDPVQPVPAVTDHQWRGHTEQRKEALQQLAGFIPDTHLGLKKECHVTGADYCKYFKRPLIPFAQQLPPDVIFALSKEDFLTAGGKDDEEQPTHFTVAVQTDYRESEAQTDPYSPEYVVQPGSTPSELLQLAALTWGRGLPAGLAEVEMIERARAKRVWEASLPPLEDLSQLDKRRRMMEEMEAKDWAFREREIEKLQEARLAVLKDLLRQRDEAQKDVTNKRLNEIYSKHKKDKETKQQKIHTDYLRSLRKLEAKWKNVEGKLERRSVSTDSLTYVRQVHRLTSRTTSSNQSERHYLDTYEGLLELEAELFKPRVKILKPKVKKDVFSTPVNRAMKLMNEYKDLREEEKKDVREKSLRFLVKTEKPVPRPATPRVEKPPEGDEETELAVICIQNLMRGRSIQYEMFKSKENRMEFINELRTVHVLQGDKQGLLKADKMNVTALKKERDEQRRKICQEEASHARVVGAELEQLFDTLSKELTRLQDERRIHAFMLLAERERRLREAEESGRRQVEERRRREDDEIFRQVVQVHQESVNLYLEDVILETLDQMADQQAREEIQRRAKEVNDIAYALEESRNSLQSEEIVSELTYSFLIPEVERIRQKVHQSQHRHLQAARGIVQGAAKPSGVLPSTPGASQVTCPSEKASSQVLEEKIGQREKGKEGE